MLRRLSIMRPAIADTRQEECQGRWRETRSNARRIASASARCLAGKTSIGRAAAAAGCARPKNGAIQRNGTKRRRRAQARQRPASITAIRSRREKLKYLMISRISGLKLRRERFASWHDSKRNKGFSREQGKHRCSASLAKH